MFRQKQKNVVNFKKVPNCFKMWNLKKYSRYHKMFLDSKKILISDNAYIVRKCSWFWKQMFEKWKKSLFWKSVCEFEQMLAHSVNLLEFLELERATSNLDVFQWRHGVPLRPPLICRRHHFDERWGSRAQNRRERQERVREIGLGICTTCEGERGIGLKKHSTCPVQVSKRFFFCQIRSRVQNTSQKRVQVTVHWPGSASPVSVTSWSVNTVTKMNPRDKFSYCSL